MNEGQPYLLLTQLLEWTRETISARNHKHWNRGFPPKVCILSSVPSVVDHHIHLPKLFNYGRESIVDVGLLRDVEFQGEVVLRSGIREREGGSGCCQNWDTDDRSTLRTGYEQ